MADTTLSQIDGEMITFPRVHFSVETRKQVHEVVCLQTEFIIDAKALLRIILWNDEDQEKLLEKMTFKSKLIQQLIRTRNKQE